MEFLYLIFYDRVHFKVHCRVGRRLGSCRLISGQPLICLKLFFRRYRCKCYILQQSRHNCEGALVFDKYNLNFYIYQIQGLLHSMYIICCNYNIYIYNICHIKDCPEINLHDPSLLHTLQCTLQSMGHTQKFMTGTQIFPISKQGGWKQGSKFEFKLKFSALLKAYDVKYILKTVHTCKARLSIIIDVH